MIGDTHRETVKSGAQARDKGKENKEAEPSETAPIGSNDQLIMGDKGKAEAKAS